jgi:phenylpropionate dioxygenase-like ring-hydroxylating dioxygenase large terminal subunit
MDPELCASLASRAIAHAAAHTTDRGTAKRIAVDEILSPERFAREQRDLFRALPAPVAIASQVRRPGDFVTAALGGVPVLVIRDREGELHAFVNACRHRGTLLLAEPCGEGRHSLRCPYHAWTYGSDGALRSLPHESCFPGLDKGEHGLVGLPHAERGGLVWVAPCASGAITMGETPRPPPLAIDAPTLLGPFEREVAALGLGEGVFYRPWQKTYDANWKLIVAGGLEAYHFRFVHAGSIYPMFFDNLLVHDRSGPLQRLVLPKRTLVEAGGADTFSALREHANLIYYLFPASLLLVQGDHVVWVGVEPLAPARSRVALTMILPEAPSSPKARAHWDKNFDIVTTALEEDFRVQERQQAGLSGGAIPWLTLGENEPGLAAFHEDVAARLGPLSAAD